MYDVIHDYAILVIYLFVVGNNVNYFTLICTTK